MKQLIYFPLVLFELLCVACHKENAFEIVGTWQLTESRTSASPEWHPANPDYQDVLEFQPSGFFIQTFEPLHENPPCTGTYQLLSDEQVRMDISCQAYPVTWSYELNEATLTFRYQGREEVAFFRYSRLD